MVKLTKIYTRTGDDGSTGLSDFSRVSKTDARIQAFADVDEANSALGVAISLAHEDFPAASLQLMTQIQNQLFDLGADLATPLRHSYDYQPIRVDASWILTLEMAIDQHNEHLEKLDSFILPGGTKLAAALHLARTVTRRAERSSWQAIEKYGTEPTDGPEGGINLIAAAYLNRLSDLLFVLARYANLNHGGDVKWIPAAHRH